MTDADYFDPTMRDEIERLIARKADYFTIHCPGLTMRVNVKSIHSYDDTVIKFDQRGVTHVILMQKIFAISFDK
ncbi:MAG TPA: hypothetical protein VKX17_00890 [Planctomycetota bacterium]|nr:hypothetical protein [Planctomycetota bacterium]